jgi:hypothetical protein
MARWWLADGKVLPVSSWDHREGAKQRERRWGSTSAAMSCSSRGTRGEEMVLDGGDRRLEEVLTDEWRTTARFGQNPMRTGVLRSSAVVRRWGGVSGELVRPRKRREKMGKRRGHRVAATTVLNRCAEVGDDRQGGTTQRERAERGGPANRRIAPRPCPADRGPAAMHAGGADAQAPAGSRRGRESGQRVGSH